MSIIDFPLDIVSLILDELVNEPSPKPLAMQALRDCSLTCRAWQPIAQQRLFKQMGLVNLGFSPLLDSEPYRGRRSFLGLLDAIQESSHWLAYVQILRIIGLVSDPEFRKIFDIFAKAGQLRSFLWIMPCRYGRQCPHWNNYPPDLRSSIEAALSSPKLTSIRLQGICDRFPLEIIGSPVLKHLEVSGESGPDTLPKALQLNGRSKRPQEQAEGKTHVEYLRLKGDSRNFLEHYRDRQDFRLGFSHLKELTVMHVQPSCTQTILNSASESLTHFSARYWSEWGNGTFDPDEVNTLPVTIAASDETQDDPLNLSFQTLSNLRVISVNIDHDPDYSNWDFYNHLLAITEMLNHSGVPNSLETLHLAISLTYAMDLFGDDSHPRRLPHHIKQKACDSKLADFCFKAKSRGCFHEVNLRFIIGDWTDIMDYFRRNGAQRTKSDGEDLGPEISQDDEFPGKARVESDTRMEERLMRDCSLPADATRADILRTYSSYNNLPGRIERTFPLLQSTGMLRLEILDYGEYYLHD